MEKYYVLEGRKESCRFVQGCAQGKMKYWFTAFYTAGYRCVVIRQYEGVRLMKEIEVVVGEDGSVSIEALGFEGKGCEDATRELERVLGEEVSDQKKPEWYRQVKQVVSQR